MNTTDRRENLLNLISVISTAVLLVVGGLGVYKLTKGKVFYLEGSDESYHTYSSKDADSKSYSADFSQEQTNSQHFDSVDLSALLDSYRKLDVTLTSDSIIFGGKARLSIPENSNWKASSGDTYADLQYISESGSAVADMSIMVITGGSASAEEFLRAYQYIFGFSDEVYDYGDGYMTIHSYENDDTVLLVDKELDGMIVALEVDVKFDDIDFVGTAIDELLDSFELLSETDSGEASTDLYSLIYEGSTVLCELSGRTIIFGNEASLDVPDIQCFGSVNDGEKAYIQYIYAYKDDQTGQEQAASTSCEVKLIKLQDGMNVTLDDVRDYFLTLDPSSKHTDDTFRSGGMDWQRVKVFIDDNSLINYYITKTDHLLVIASCCCDADNSEELDYNMQALLSGFLFI